MEWLDGIVETYPGVALALMVGLFLLNSFWWRSLTFFVKREFLAMETHQTRQDAAIESIQSRLSAYDISFAVSGEKFDALVALIEGHVSRENEIPGQIAAIGQDIEWIKREMLNERK